MSCIVTFDLFCHLPAIQVIIAAIVTEGHFRQNLVDMERENTELKTRLSHLEGKLGTVNTDTSKMQRRIRSLEKANDELARSTSVFERECKQLKSQVSAKVFQ